MAKLSRFWTAFRVFQFALQVCCLTFHWTQGSRTWRTFSDPALTQNHFLRKRRLRKRESKREKERERNRARERAREREREREKESKRARKRERLSLSLSLTFSQNSPLSLIRDRRIAQVLLPYPALVSCPKFFLRC